MNFSERYARLSWWLLWPVSLMCAGLGSIVGCAGFFAVSSVFRTVLHADWAAPTAPGWHVVGHEWETALVALVLGACTGFSLAHIPGEFRSSIGKFSAFFTYLCSAFSLLMAIDTYDERARRMMVSTFGLLLVWCCLLLILNRWMIRSTRSESAW